MPTTNLIITGTYRSGTTLLEKMLHMHPDAAVFSQPFPFLYTELKRRFLSSLGFSDRYPLGSLFRERRYRRGAFEFYLASTLLPEDSVRRSAVEQKGYSGFWTPELLDHIDELGSGAFIDVRQRANKVLASHFDKPDATVLGSKEILVEEFIPHLTHARTKVILMLRDPRSVMASLNFGSGMRYGGARRPTLFHLRNWRRSAAFALAGYPADQLLTVHYEDLIKHPRRTLVQICEFLDLDYQAIPDPDGPLVDQRHEAWHGNSSFDTLGPVDRWRHMLDEATIGYIETCALPEMLALGYRPSRVRVVDSALLASFREPFAIEREDLAPDFSTQTRRLGDEVQRLILAQRTDLTMEDAEEWFIFEPTHSRLRLALLEYLQDPWPRSGSGTAEQQPETGRIGGTGSL